MAKACKSKNSINMSIGGNNPVCVLALDIRYYMVLLSRQVFNGWNTQEKSDQECTMIVHFTCSSSVTL